jgi:hypothetical protein
MHNGFPLSQQSGYRGCQGNAVVAVAPAGATPEGFSAFNQKSVGQFFHNGPKGSKHSGHRGDPVALLILSLLPLLRQVVFFGFFAAYYYCRFYGKTHYTP